ncbi:MAG: tyrosine-type recombinase/integrase [Pseudomonadota bacterium]
MRKTHSAPCARSVGALAVDSKLRGCDLVRLRVEDVYVGGSVRDRAMIVQKKTGRPEQFEITAATATSLKVWINTQSLKPEDSLFPSRISAREHLSERQYNRIVLRSVAEIGLDPSNYGTHSLCRTKATQIYRKTGNLRAIQLLLDHTKIESTVRYLEVDVDDALSIPSNIDV